MPLAAIPIHCAICTELVPEARLKKKAVTCCPQHAKALKNARRRRRDHDKCRLCGVPSTIDERKLFQQWRRETNQKKKPGRPSTKRKEPETAPVDFVALSPMQGACC